MNHLDFTEAEHQALRALVRAGHAGLELGTEIPTSTAIRLELSGLAELRAGEAVQMAHVTRKGEAFLYRTVR